MADDPRINELVEEALDTERTPLEVCHDCLELLTAVQARWEKVHQLQDELDAIFPTSSDGLTGPSWPSLERSIVSLKIPGYELMSVLGKGGMGVVYQARQLKLNRIVALKMLLTGTHPGSIEQERFQREAEAVATLHSNNIVQIYDVGEHEGQPFFTMEYVAGGSLAQELAGTPIPATQAAEKAVLLANAVAVAHANCIVHRDLKPSNILLTADGTLKITDFGLARKLSNDSDLTISGARLGTPSYMAPEQALGQANAICPAVDIYALGAILYEMLTGRPPFRAETASETERQVISEEPVLPTKLNAKVPKDLETICLKCLRKDPARRYGTAKELADDLRRYLNGQPITARAIGRAERLLHWVQHNRTTSALIMTAMLLCVIAVAAAWREQEYRVRHRAEAAKWSDRLAFMSKLQQENRFAEARAVLQEAQTDDSELQAQIAQARANLSLVERLDAVRLGRDRLQQDGNINYAESSRQYETVFREAGLGTFQDDPERVAESLKTSTILSALIAAMDDWAACAGKKERDWVLRVVRKLDPDPWRDQVRDINGWAKHENFPALAKAADVAAQPVTLMVAFGTRWRRLGGDPTAFLERVQRRHPNDFWVNFELSHLFTGIDVMKSMGYGRAALAVRPDSTWVNYKLGVGHWDLKQYDVAIHHFQRTVEVDPNFFLARIYLGNRLVEQGKREQAIEQWKLALAVAPGLNDVRAAVCGHLMLLGRKEEAHEVWHRLLQNRQTNFEDWDGYAELSLFLGKKDEYHRVCKYLLEQFGTSKDPRVSERMGRACLLSPESPQQLQSANALIDQALGADKTNLPPWIEPYFLFAQGLAEYRANRLENAVKILQGKASTAMGPAPKLVLSMSFSKLGKEYDARMTFDQAISAFDWRLENATQTETWIYHILRKEAEQLIAK